MPIITLLNVFLVATGGALGSVLRYFFSVVGQKIHFPAYLDKIVTPITIVNIVGSLIMGLFIGYLSKSNNFASQDYIRLFIATGVLGGFTTFSAFSMECLNLINAQKYADAAIYAFISVFFSILSVYIGFHATR